MSVAHGIRHSSAADNVISHCYNDISIIKYTTTVRFMCTVTGHLEACENKEIATYWQDIACQDLH